MCVCVWCVCVCVCAHACMCVCVCVCVCACTCMCVCVCVCVCAYLHVCESFVSPSVNLCVCMSVCVCCMCICVWMYVYMHMRTHVYSPTPQITIVFNSDEKTSLDETSEEAVFWKRTSSVMNVESPSVTISVTHDFFLAGAGNRPSGCYPLSWLHVFTSPGHRAGLLLQGREIRSQDILLHDRQQG